MSCRCAPGLSGLGLGPAPRQLSAGEIANFLFRHPVVALQVGETQTAIDSGVYDWDYVGDWRFPGLIPPYGLQVQDSTYGLVTVQIARDAQAYYTANSPDLGTSAPDYQSQGLTLDDMLTSAKNAILIPVLLFAGVYLWTHRRG